MVAELLASIVSLCCLISYTKLQKMKIDSKSVHNCKAPLSIIFFTCTVVQLLSCLYIIKLVVVELFAATTHKLKTYHLCVSIMFLAFRCICRGQNEFDRDLRGNVTMYREILSVAKVD